MRCRSSTSCIRSPMRRPGRWCCRARRMAFTDTPIYARTNGYLKRWYFDIGAHVHQGQLLAQIETPELDAATAPGARRSDDGGGQRQAGRHHRAAHREPAEDPVGLDAGTRQCRRCLCRRPGDRRLAPGRRGAAGGAAVLREGLCAVRRRDHRAQHRCRRPDQCRRRHARRRAVPHDGDQDAAHLCRGAGDRCALPSMSARRPR